MKRRSKIHYGFAIVAAVFIDLLVCGGIFFGASGIFIVPVSTALGIGQGQFSLELTIQSLTIAVGVLLAPRLLAKYSFRTLNAISFVVAGMGFVLMGFSQNALLLYVGGVMIGLGCVFLTYLIAGTLLPHWFSQNLGTAIAVAMAGLGLGGIIFNPVISALVNGNGLLGFAEGWRSAYVILGGFVTIVCLPLAIFVIRDNPSDRGLLPYGAGNVTEEKGVRVSEGVEKSVAVKSASFVWYCIMVLCFTLSGAIMSYLPALASQSAAGSRILGIIGSVGMCGAILGGFVIGAANDRFGAHIGGLVAGGFILMMIGRDNPVLLLAGGALYGIFYQINQVQMPAMVRMLYGDLDYDRIFPLGATISPWVGTVSFSLWGFLFDATGSYNVMLLAGITCGILTAVTGILAVISGRKLPRKRVEVR